MIHMLAASWRGFPPTREWRTRCAAGRGGPLGVWRGARNQGRDAHQTHWLYQRRPTRTGTWPRSRRSTCGTPCHKSLS